MPQRHRPNRKPQIAAVGEFLALTFLIVSIAYTAGSFIRQQTRPEAAGPVALMNVTTRAAETIVSAGTVDRIHRLVEAAAPATLAMPEPAPAPKPAPASAKPQAAKAKPAAAPLSFDGRPLRKVRTMRMLVTAYSPDERSCGASADGITASGYSVWTNGMKMVAADTRVLPMHSVISVPGYNGARPVPVLDRGGAIKGNRLDVLYPTHEIARKWGKQWLTVTVYEYAD